MTEREIAIKAAKQALELAPPQVRAALKVAVAMRRRLRKLRRLKRWL